MSWDQLDHMLSKFNFSFNWEYSGDLELRMLLNDVFRILEGEDERSLEQILIGCVHQACPGLTLNQPKDDPSLPYEMNFIVHPSLESFCITKVIILSEARNLELYVNGVYEKSSRGIRLTMNQGRKLSLFEVEFDLSSYISTKSNATIKFLSYPCKNQLKIQAVVMKVEKCQPISCNEEQTGASVDLSSVKRYLGSVGRPLSNDAQKMLQSIENYQKSPAFKAQQMMSTQNALLQNALLKDVANRLETSATKEIVKGNEKSQVNYEKSQVKDEKGLNEECSQVSQLEEDGPFMNMLAELCLKENECSGEKPPKTDVTSPFPQSRWAAYLQSRVRASKKISSESPPRTLRSMSVEGSLGASEDHLGKVKPRRRPYSVGCVDSGEMDEMFNLEMLRQKWAQETEHSRCKTCGCPGCLSVYNSVTTSIYAAEERILEKVDKKFAQLQEGINEKFQLLFQLLGKRQEIDDEEVVRKSQR